MIPILIITALIVYATCMTTVAIMYFKRMKDFENQKLMAESDEQTTARQYKEACQQNDTLRRLNKHFLKRNK